MSARNGATPVHQEMSRYTLLAVVPPDNTPATTQLPLNITSNGPPLSLGAVVASNITGMGLLPAMVLLPAVRSSKSVEKMLLPDALAGLP